MTTRCSKSGPELSVMLGHIASLGYGILHNEINVIAPWCTELTLLRVQQ